MEEINWKYSERFPQSFAKKWKPRKNKISLSFQIFAKASPFSEYTWGITQSI